MRKRYKDMASIIKDRQGEALSNLQESLKELIKYTYLSGLQDGKENWYENEQILGDIGNKRVSKIISVLNIN
jgi:hypothetical protein